MNQPSPAAGLDIQIANIKVHLDCSNPSVLSSLGERYKRFISVARVPALLSIHLKTEFSDASCDLGRAIPEYHDGQVNISAEGCKAWIDLGNRRGMLELRSKHPVDEIDYFLRIAYAWLSFEAGGMLFHAAGVRRDGLVHIFFGPSGAGKTTAARFSTPYEVFNDDLLLLAPDGNRWWAASTPFTNPTQVAPAPGRAPLAGLYRLVQDERVFLDRLSLAEAVAEVLASVPVLSRIPECAAGLLTRCQRLVGAHPVYQLHFRKDGSFWELLR